MPDEGRAHRRPWAMLSQKLHMHPAWGPVHRASSGLIYGSVLVLSLLMAMDEMRDRSSKPAIVLFGSVLAVTLAKVFAEVLAHAMETRERILTRKAFLSAWRQNHTPLIVAAASTLFFVLAALGWFSIETATGLAQLFCVVVLVVLGARVGWVIDPGWRLSITGALFAGSVGVGLAAMKYAIH